MILKNTIFETKKHYFAAYPYWRIIVKGSSDTSAQKLQISEFELCDIDHNDLTSGLVFVGKDVEAYALAEGQCSVTGNATLNTGDTLDKMFDRNVNTYFWAWPEITFSEDASTWTYINLNIGESGNDAYFWRMRNSEINSSRMPTVLVIQRSTDGVSWNNWYVGDSTSSYELHGAKTYATEFGTSETYIKNNISA